MMSQTIRPPHTYAEWSSIINELKLKTDDEAVLEAMKKGTLEWQSGVAERFTKKLVDAVNYRINSASDKFQKNISHASGREGAIVQALLSLRKELRFLAEVVTIPPIPKDISDMYYNIIVGDAEKIQSSLEESAKHDRSGKLYSIIKNNRVNAF